MKAEDSPGQIDPSVKMGDITFVAFDTETTGLSPKSNRVLEIGAVKFRSGKILGHKAWLINPGEHIPYFATQVHGITDDMVKDKPSFKKVYSEFREFSKGSVLIAHNSRFDRDFMHAEMERAGIDSDQFLLFDSLKIFRKTIPDAPSHSIGGLVEYLHIDAGDFHRALIDSVYIVKIMDKTFADRWDKVDLATLLEYNGGPDQL